MNEFILSTDSTADIPDHLLKEHQIAVANITYRVDDVNYLGADHKKLTDPEFYQKMREGSTPQTSQVTPEQALNFFEELLKEGRDILHLTFSSALSGTYNSMKMAAEELREKYPEQKIIVIDSLCASMGEALFVCYAAWKRKEGLSIDETADYLKEIRLHLCHGFTVEDLKYLHRGGRVSKASAIVGSVLGIKPILHVDDEGRLVPISKVRGRRQSLNALVDYMGERYEAYGKQPVFISHGDCIKDAEYVASQVKERFGISDFTIHFIGPAIGSHSGPGTVAIFFLGSKR
ncbi:DegV family protein [Candidatus Soleaferrea massiliensis]|uniref:DegV family protein n=1 Tax=Candidatus Soleaferrea massiliensis TaxID=1470354 RepID=UPI00058BF250|nr:DegV family protein [Candidatus Soleaferrea massiliensis]